MRFDRAPLSLDPRIGHECGMRNVVSALELRRLGAQRLYQLALELRTITCTPRSPCLSPSAGAPASLIPDTCVTPTPGWMASRTPRIALDKVPRLAFHFRVAAGCLFARADNGCRLSLPHSPRVCSVSSLSLR